METVVLYFNGGDLCVTGGKRGKALSAEEEARRCEWATFTVSSNM